MRKINVAEYMVTVPNPNASPDLIGKLDTAIGMAAKMSETLYRDILVEIKEIAGSIEWEIPYNVKESLVACLFHPDLKLGARELVTRDRIATKIEEAEGAVLLEEVEYQKLLSAFETVKGFGKAEIELVTRVFEAEEIAVAETA